MSELRRVVITGVGGVSPLVTESRSPSPGWRRGVAPWVSMEDHRGFNGLRSHVGAPAEMQDEKAIPARTGAPWDG